MAKFEGDSGYNKDLCELRHLATQKEVEEVRRDIAKETHDIWIAIDGIRDPAHGHIAAAKSEIMTRMDKKDSRLNGIILAILAGAASIIAALAPGLLERLTK